MNKNIFIKKIQIWCSTPSFIRGCFGGLLKAGAEEQAACQTSAGTQLVATTQQAPAEEHSQATRKQIQQLLVRSRSCKEATVAERQIRAGSSSLLKNRSRKEAILFQKQNRK